MARVNKKKNVESAVTETVSVDEIVDDFAGEMTENVIEENPIEGLPLVAENKEEKKANDANIEKFSKFEENDEEFRKEVVGMMPSEEDTKKYVNTVKTRAKERYNEIIESERKINKIKATVKKLDFGWSWNGQSID